MCLQNAPKVKKWGTIMDEFDTPGWMYPINAQCQLQFGLDYVVCPYAYIKDNPGKMQKNKCRRLWCTNNVEHSGCVTKHQPWADGTKCGHDMVCIHGDCIPTPDPKAKVINGGWGPWLTYGECSRTCGGGVKMKYRECNSPVPANGGKFCLGYRVKYKSCNIEACPEDSIDFREIQCNDPKQKRMWKKLNQTVVWKPKYSGVHMKDACKLFCIVGATDSKTYFLMNKKVLDGTKCGPFTDDVCVNGHCRHVGCDNRLGSNMKRDRCGVCDGDNYTCRTVSGVYNNAGLYGYRDVCEIPIGATEIDIRQYGPPRGDKDDNNYLALEVYNENGHGRKSILNGNSMVRTEPMEVKIHGASLDYTGINAFTERINTSMVIAERLVVVLLSTHNLLPPNITFSYQVSVTKKVIWRNQGWTKCGAVCHGSRKSKIVCMREDDRQIVSDKRCKGLPRPKHLTEDCNTDCDVNWRIINQEDCPVRCGPSLRRQLVRCVKTMGYMAEKAEIINDHECSSTYGSKPPDVAECQGQCLPTFWSYTQWSSCSVTCGEGVQERQSKCVDELGEEQRDGECSLSERMTSRPCSLAQCADWVTGDWLGCSVTCGFGMKIRKVWCMLDGEKVDELACGNKKPAGQKDCDLKDCPEWYTGGWGPCSVTCGKGVSMRAVKCRVSDSFSDDSVCDAGMRPNDKRSCFIGPCPTTPSPPMAAPRIFTKSSSAYWRYGSWTECSSTCGQGSKHRYVSCMDYDNNHIPDADCAHLTRPNKVETCMLKPCGDWRQGGWGDCTVTCGEGVQTRFVACTFNKQRQDDRFCDVTSKPVAEIRCNRGTCITPDDFRTVVITSNNVEGTSHWRAGGWSACSTTCGIGHERRHVMCRDERGDSDKCGLDLKPDDFRECDMGDCPTWMPDPWGNCTALDCGTEGFQTRVVACRLSSGEVLANSNCDSRTRPTDYQQCAGTCGPSGTTDSWHRGEWSQCSVTCGQGMRSRPITCVDEGGNPVSYDRCHKKKPRGVKRCSKGPCPKWYPLKWSRCSVTCGEGQRRRAVQCRAKRYKLVNPTLCSHQSKPVTVTRCTRRECSLHAWKTGTWSECSRTCGFGRKHRSVTCVDSLGLRVSSHLCDTAKKPKVKRRCSEFPCPSMWNTGPWSECSQTCGIGHQTRSVVCQAVTKEGWILPGEVIYGCRRAERPKHNRMCNYGDCNAHNHWTVGAWGKCSANCGHGKQRRQVICVDNMGGRTTRRQCYKLNKPSNKRDCYSGHCYASSCEEFKKVTTIRKDGDYQLKVGNQLVKIYCKDMRTRRPKEYISLTQGPSDNFSETFDKRLRRPGTCPNEGQRPAPVCTDCRRNTYEKAGITTFSKIRIDLDTLTIDTTDGAFSDVRRGRFTHYGSAGDCYSSSKCPQGRFSVNLVDTGFIVSMNTTWLLEGHHTSQRIWRIRDGQIIQGVCGGYCGQCAPDPIVGLKLDLHR